MLDAFAGCKHDGPECQQFAQKIAAFDQDIVRLAITGMISHSSRTGLQHSALKIDAVD